MGPEKGRFRSFLLACLKHFLADNWDKARRLKRGGASPALSLDFEEAEGRYQHEGYGEPGADQLYEQRWALDLLASVLACLRREAVQAGKVAVFDQLQSCLWGERISKLGFAREEKQLMARNSWGDLLFWRVASFAEIEAQEKRP